MPDGLGLSSFQLRVFAQFRPSTIDTLKDSNTVPPLLLNVKIYIMLFLIIIVTDSVILCRHEN